MRRRTVIVTDAGLAQGITVMRSLGRAGWRVVALDSSPLSPAFASRYVAERHVIPSPEHAPSAAADSVIRLARSANAHLVVPSTDQMIFALIERAADLSVGTVLAAAQPEALQVARAKDQTLELADRVGVAVPGWRLATSDAEVRRYATQLGWPVVCKPVMSHVPTANGAIETRAVTFARTPAQLDAQLARGTIGPPLLVQEYVAGTGLGVDLLCHEGRILAAFQHRRLREVPIWGGMSSSRVSEAVDPALLNLSRALLEPLAWSGLAMVEFRQTRSGPVLMEINGRVWGSIALPVRAGMDFPRRLAELCTCGPPPPGPPAQEYRVGVECRNLALELRWAIQAVKRSATPTGVPPGSRRAAGAVVAGLLDPRNEFDVQTLVDPLPGLVDATRALAAPVREASRRAFQRRGRSGRDARPDTDLVEG